MDPLRIFLAFFVLSLSLLTVGCEHGFCTVAGKVLLDGEPITDGRIALLPKDNTSGVRTTQAVVSDGDFSFVRSQGIVPGTYSVVITARRKTGQSLPVEEGSGEIVDRYEQYLPAKYNTNTELNIEVVGDTNDLLFELELPQQGNKFRR